MKIEFHSVRGKNFLQIGNEFEAFRLDSDAFTVIVGKNGTGKSTILDLITYALYKRAYRPKIKLGQLINNTNKKNMLVEIAFSIGKDLYVVRRGEKPKVFEIYKNKELIEVDPSINDMQSHLEDVILKQNFKTFSQINVISKVSYTQFMDLTPADRRIVVENILDTNVYSAMAVLGKSDLKELNENYGNLTTELQIISNRIEDTRNILDSYQKNRDAEIGIMKDQLKNKNEELINLTKTRANAEKLLNETKQEAEDIIPSIHIDKVHDEITKMVGQIAEQEAIIRKANNIIDKIDSLDECPHCMQIVDSDHKKSIVGQNLEERAEAHTVVDPIRKKLEGFRARLKDRDAKVELARKRKHDLDHIDNQIKIAENAIVQINSHIKKLNEDIKLDNVPNITELEDQLLEVSNQRDILKTKIQNLQSAIKLLGDDGIKAQVIDKYIPIINEKLNDYLQRMNLFVEFNLDSEFNENINAINRDLFTYHSFSEGQKMRIDLAILLTWRYISQIRNSMSTNLFILDEVADGSLDDEGMIEFMDILRDLSDAQNTFVISHKESTIENSTFESVIRVYTEGNFSKYVKE